MTPRYHGESREPRYPAAVLRANAKALALALVLPHCGGGATSTTADGRGRRLPDAADTAGAIASTLPPLRLTPRRAVAGVTEDAATSFALPPLAGPNWSSVSAACAEAHLDASEVRATEAPLRALATDACTFFPGRYGMGLGAPIRVVFFSDPAAFEAAVSHGFDGDGAYADGVVALRSPRGGARVWGETFVHELSHAFADAASGGRAPRWFLEGLAELDAAHFEPTFVRELQRARESVLADGEGDALSRTRDALAHPRDGEELGGAYAAARALVAHFEARFGAGAVARLLGAYREGLGDDDAMVRATGETRAGFLRSFEEAREAELESAARHLPTLTPSIVGADGRPAFEALVRGDYAEALALARAFATREPASALATHLLLRAELAADPASLVATLEAFERAGGRAFEVSIALARIAYLGGDHDQGCAHADRAVALDPTEVAGHDARLRCPRLSEEDRSSAARAIVELDPGARELASDLVVHAPDAASAERGFRRLVFVDPELAARALAAFRAGREVFQ